MLASAGSTYDSLDQNDSSCGRESVFEGLTQNIRKKANSCVGSFEVQNRRVFRIDAWRLIHFVSLHGTASDFWSFSVIRWKFSSHNPFRLVK